MFQRTQGDRAIMVYRIRYCDGRSPHGGAEAVVKAATPTEALVKFCHTLPDSPDPARALGMVTRSSISKKSAVSAPSQAMPAQYR